MLRFFTTGVSFFETHAETEWTTLELELINAE